MSMLLKPTFIYIVKLGFTVLCIFLVFASRHGLWVLAFRPFLCVPAICVLGRNRNDIACFHLKIILFTAVKYRSISHRHFIVTCASWLKVNMDYSKEHLK